MTVAILTALTLLFAAISRAAPKNRGERLFRPEQFRPGAPLGGIVEHHDELRRSDQ